MTPTPTGAPGDAPADRGVSLVEVMVAMVLFLVGSLSLLSVLTSTLSGTFDNRARITAANLAAADIDEARSLDYYSLVNRDVTRTVDGRSYRIVRTVATTMASGANTSSCVGAGSAKQLYKRVTSRVEASFRGTAQPVRADTLVKAPVFDPNSARGAIAFQVIDRTGTPLSGLPVSIPGTNLTSDSRGCTFFDALLPGSYDVTVQRTGSVTVEGSSTLTKKVAVSAGQITSDALRIHTSVSIRVTSDLYNNGAVVTSSNFSWPTNLIARLSAPDRATLTRFRSASQSLPSRGSSATWTSFPSPGGYDAHHGPCSLVVHTDSEPGTSPNVIMPLSGVTVSVSSATGTDKQRNKKVTVTSAVPGCTESVTFTDAASTTSSTCSNDCKVHLALPPGFWRFTVDGSFTDHQVASGTTSSTTVVAIP